jgi:hypothetical protein
MKHQIIRTYIRQISPIRRFDRNAGRLCQINDKFDKKRRKKYLQKAKKWLYYFIGIKYKNTRTYHL